MEGSTVLLKCSPTFRWMEWFGPAHTQISHEIPVVDMFGHRRMWKVTRYSQGKSIIPTLPHSNRLQVIKRMRTDDFDLQIINASILDEGVYLCWRSCYILKMIRSTALLKCKQDMEWFGPAHFNSFSEPSVIAMHENRSMWTANRYTEGNSVSPTLPHHNRLKVIRKQQTGDYGLQISNASVLDEGLYFCEDSEMHAVWNYYILQLITVKLAIHDDMTNLTVCICVHQLDETMVSSMHPMIEEINEGETKTLCCYVDSNPTIWVKKRNKAILVTHNVNESCYTIQHVNRDDQGNYTCIANNMVGNGSLTIVLRVRYTPEISIMQDLITNIHEGDTRKLCCYIESNPTPTLTRWLNGSQEILASFNVKDICYTIYNVNRYDQGIYTCTAENIIGSGSNTTVLQVKCKFGIRYFEFIFIHKPSVSSMQDLIEEINEGKKKKLCCYVDSNPIPTSTRWLNGSQEILITHNVNKTCYTIKSVNRYDQGNYTCIAENIIGTGSVTTILKVKYKPEVSVKPFIEDIQEGETKKMCCYVDSNPAPTSTMWLHRGQKILVTNNETEICYTINYVSRYDQGNYTCIAENVIGSGSVTIDLKVKYKPLVSSFYYDLFQERNEGEKMELCCYVDSNPTPIVTRWLNGIKEILVIHNVSNACYTIRNVSRYDQGNYTCIAENIIGIGSVTVVLKVKYKPVVSRKHDLIEEIHEGETMNLCCYVDSNTAITSTSWLNGSQEIFVTHNVAETCYTIKNVSRYDQGIYTCIAHNAIGSGSMTTVLQVKCEFGYENCIHNTSRISTINSETPRGNDDESGYYMEINMIDDNIVTSWQENKNPNITTVERAVVENRDIAQVSAGHSSTSTDDDRNSSVYLDDGYEHPYNTLLANIRAEDEHVYLTPKKTSDNANSTPSENDACGCSYEFTEQDSSLDKTETRCYASDGEEHSESEF
ncbi:unnamed protein product [Mytilus coruscus]|uniref:Ig-like domain-containing protein n=1 Tax=Mytilus coruscus TaxID=42192 RepID=A0A6J8ESW6_MYTCO|nr:unnamed protein product [Mytilus coruscus]